MNSSSTTTPFLSELIEMKMKRANCEAIENDYIDNPLLAAANMMHESPPTPHQMMMCTTASDDDVIRRALSLTNSLPGRLDFHPQHRHHHSALMMMRQTPPMLHHNNRMLMSPGAVPGRPETALTSHPPPVPPRPLKSLSCGDGDLGGNSPSSAAGAMTSPPMFRRKPSSSSRGADPPPRPPKSPDVIALMLTHHHHQPTTTTTPPQFRASHPSLRDRRGDVIEPSNHRQQRHHQRSQRSATEPTVVTAQPIRHQQQQPKPKKTSDKEAIRIEDDVTREKERLKNDVSSADDDEITIANRKLPSLPPPLSLSQEEMTSCPHCGKCLHQQQQLAEKQLVVTSQASKVTSRNRERRSGLELSCTECVECVTCVSGVKCCFYHCADDSAGERMWADKPCACHGVDCRLRWLYLLGLSLCFPCLLCYPLVRAVTRPKCTSCCCDDHYLRGGNADDGAVHKMRHPCGSSLSS